jgi:hypothetical protein
MIPIDELSPPRSTTSSIGNKRNVAALVQMLASATIWTGKPIVAAPA